MHLVCRKYRLRTSGCDGSDIEGANARSSADFGNGDGVARNVTRTTCSNIDRGDVSQAVGVDGSGSGVSSTTREGNGQSSLRSCKGRCGCEGIYRCDTSSQLISVNLEYVGAVTSDRTLP